MRGHSGRVRELRQPSQSCLWKRISVEDAHGVVGAYRFGFEEREYSYSPIGFPTAVCANVVDSEICPRSVMRL
jgi:hypothetical protein